MTCLDHQRWQGNYTTVMGSIHGQSISMECCTWKDRKPLLFGIMHLKYQYDSQKVLEI